MNQTLDTLIRLFERDLGKLESEIRLYPDEGSLWKAMDGITNCGGNLCLHLCGNLQHYFGAVLGHTGYQRDRPLEFSAKDVPRDQMLKEIQESRKAVLNVLRKLKPSELEEEYPEVVFDEPMTTGYFLIHLAGHLNYHLGQVNYHRRMSGG
jgi:hypothetical protein